MTRLLIALLALSAPVCAENMRPIKEPVPSPSDLRAERGQDRPQGQAPEARTPSPSDLAVERPLVSGDRPASGILDPRSAGAGGSRPVPSPSELESGPAPQFR